MSTTGVIVHDTTGSYCTVKSFTYAVKTDKVDEFPAVRSSQVFFTRGFIFTISYHCLHDFTIACLPSMLGRLVCLSLLRHKVKVVSCGQTLSMLTGAYQLEL